MSDLFEQPSEEKPDLSASRRPLAARMRPRTLEDIVGQDHMLGEGKLLRRAIEADRLASLILYGPPGCGKTSLAEVIARTEVLGAYAGGSQGPRRAFGSMVRRR